MKSEILVLRCTAYNYVDKVTAQRKQGAEVTYLTGNMVAEGYGNNSAAGLEVISMFADYKCFARLEHDMPCYAEAQYDQTTRRDSFGNDMVTLRMVDVRVLGPATIGREEPTGSAANNGAGSPSAVGSAK